MENNKNYATYVSGQVPDAYLGLNPNFIGDTASNLEAVDRGDLFRKYANHEGLASQVKVVPLPVEIPTELSELALNETMSLRDAGYLSTLRGGRRTDLARPLAADVRSAIESNCPALQELVRKIETGIYGSHLFIRAIKLDDSRMSTTQPDTSAVHTPYLHFDAQGYSLTEYFSPVYQYFANIGTLPRIFTILPIPAPEMIKKLVEDGENESVLRATKMQDLLTMFQSRFKIPYERIVINSGQMAIFDGRAFAHDGGKMDMDALSEGKFIPSPEPDFVLTLDSVINSYHEGYYFPDQSILQDPGTEAWWEMMRKFNS